MASTTFLDDYEEMLNQLFLDYQKAQEARDEQPQDEAGKRIVKKLREEIDAVEAELQKRKDEVKAKQAEAKPEESAARAEAGESGTETKTEESASGGDEPEAAGLLDEAAKPSNTDEREPSGSDADPEAGTSKEATKPISIEEFLERARRTNYYEKLLKGFGTPESTSRGQSATACNHASPCNHPKGAPPGYSSAARKLTQRPPTKTKKNEKVIDVKEIEGFRGLDDIDDLLKYIHGEEEPAKTKDKKKNKNKGKNKKKSD